MSFISPHNTGQKTRAHCDQPLMLWPLWAVGVPLFGPQALIVLCIVCWWVYLSCFQKIIHRLSVFLAFFLVKADSILRITILDCRWSQVLFKNIFFYDNYWMGVLYHKMAVYFYAPPPKKKLLYVKFQHLHLPPHPPDESLPCRSPFPQAVRQAENPCSEIPALQEEGEKTQCDSYFRGE